MESVIDMMRDDIKVNLNTSRNDITNGFDISFRYRDPKVTQAVTAELAGKYISVQTQNTVVSTQAARQFMDNQVNQARAALAEVDKQILDFKSQHVGNLPSEAESLFNQLNGLREEQKALISEIGTVAGPSCVPLLAQLTTLKEANAVAIEDAATASYRSKDDPGLVATRLAQSCLCKVS